MGEVDAMGIQYLYIFLRFLHTKMTLQLTSTKTILSKDGNFAN